MSVVDVSIREYGRLTTDPCARTLDACQISPSAFQWLCGLQSRIAPGGASLLELDGARWLRLNSLVGVIQTPCGTRLEILPKTHEDANDPLPGRRMLRKMVSALLDLPAKEAGAAHLKRFDVPLTEWVMERFLHALERLVVQGLRRDYVRIEEELPYLRGRLNVDRQIRQSPGRQHLFHVRHDVFVPDRAENRLLKLALERVRKATRNADNWRLAHELSARMQEIPASQRVQDDWRAWSDSRLMAGYRSVLPWCALVLGQGMPLALSGAHQGLSVLFPMEKLFEAYVARWLRKRLPPDLQLVEQSRSESLCLHMGSPIFELRPDLLICDASKNNRMVLDTKWKRIDAGDRPGKYGISEADVYQMLAYGTTYLKGAGPMALIYPAWSRFNKPLSSFHLGMGLDLTVVPFDVERDSLAGETSGQLKALFDNMRHIWPRAGMCAQAAPAN